MTSRLAVMGRMAMRPQAGPQPTTASGVAIPGRSLMSMNALLLLLFVNVFNSEFLMFHKQLVSIQT